MKIITLIGSALMASTAFASSPTITQQVKYMEISFGCHNLQPSMNEFGINYGFQSGEERLVADSRLRVNGTRLELVSADEERTVVIGIVQGTPTCKADDENPVDGTASWNVVALSPMVTLTASLTPGTDCHEQDATFQRTDKYSVNVSSAYLLEMDGATFTSYRTSYFPTMEACQN
jgi:hypothetical protein